ncbi:MAG TPA: VOC family protein [Acidimicrobiia bacterium]|jgi:uncharacterized glyoxalase superfamily protein PhnB
MATLDAFGVICSDMAESVRFYSLLGLDIDDDAAREQHVDIDLGGGMRLMLDSVELIRSFSPWEPPTGGHRVSMAFRCDNPADVDRTHAAVVDAGYPSLAPPVDAFWGQRYATVADPDGNPVDLYAAL